MKLEIPQDDAEYMYDVIQKIIDEAGCRMPCSPQEAKGAEMIKAEMEKTCDEAIIEPFTCHPRAFLGWIRIVIIMVLSSFGCFYLTQLLNDKMWTLILMIIAVAIIIVVFIIAWNEFFNYREFIDKLFKEKSSQNVVGKIKAKGELKKIILFAGHHDSALQFNLLRYLKAGYGIIIFLGLGILFIWIFTSIIILFAVWTVFFSASFDTVFFNGFVNWLLVIGTIPLIGLFFFVSPGERANKVPGAVDNLSAVAVTLGVGRYLKNHKDIIPDNTEIRLLSFGCEEAGLRGAYRYAAAHREELLKYDAELVNMDGIQSAKNTTVVEFEPTTRTKHSKEVVEKVRSAAASVDIPISTMGSTFLEKFIGQISGGTDATAFSKAGIKAANISAMEIRKFLKFYHQPSDRLDMIDRGALENTLAICIGYVKNASKKSEDINPKSKGIQK